MASPPTYEAKNMIFRRLGPSGLRVPLFALGGWLTLGATLTGDPVKEIMKTAFENGINMFDTSENYAQGKGEIEMGRVIKELGWRRSDIIVTTKVFYGTGGRNGPNDTGLSRKHVIEGVNGSLERLQLDYVDIVFAHRPDPTVPMEEIVRAFNHLINQGKVFYWGTSEWPASEIEAANLVAEKLNLVAPIAEQVQHHLFNRERAEGEYAPIYEKYGIGTTVWSALDAGVLTGKYNKGIPENTRFAHYKDFFSSAIKRLQETDKLDKVAKLQELAEKELGCSVAALALAWVAQQPQTSTVILGASKPEYIPENLKALEVIPKLTPEILEKIEAIVQNKPAGKESERPPP